MQAGAIGFVLWSTKDGGPHLGYLYKKSDPDPDYQIPSINIADGDDLYDSLKSGENVTVELQDTGISSYQHPIYERLQSLAFPWCQRCRNLFPSVFRNLRSIVSIIIHLSIARIHQNSRFFPNSNSIHSIHRNYSCNP